MEEKQTTSLSLSEYTQALIKVWRKEVPQTSPNPNKISVSQTVSFLAFLYEKMRNAVEFREEHLIRRAAIERIIKRRMILNGNGRDIAEPLIKELLWARYLENNTLGDEKIKEVQSSIDKYFLLRNELTRGRDHDDKEKLNRFFLDVSSCEIEEILSPAYQREAFVHFVYQLTRPYIASLDEEGTERDIQVYIAVERAFAHSDDALIRYHLLKLYLPNITKITWKEADKVLPKLYDIYEEIEKNLRYPLRDKLRNIIKKQMPPFFILRDIFEQNSSNIEEILKKEELLKHKVDEACRRRYDQTKVRLRRTGIRSFIYIVLTKVIFAFLIEIPYDLYIVNSISYFPIIINVIFPPFLMSIIILSVSLPGDDNTRKIFSLIKNIITTDAKTLSSVSANIVIRAYRRTRGFIFSGLFTFIYLLTYIITFGGIIYLLSHLNFSPVSQAIFIFFVTLVTFFAYRVVNITHEYLVVDKEGALTPLVDFFFLPIIRVGQWLSGEVLTKFNVLIFIFDFIIEMPLKAVVEVIDEWVHFVRIKKEEIV